MPGRSSSSSRDWPSIALCTVVLMPRDIMAGSDLLDGKRCGYGCGSCYDRVVHNLGEDPIRILSEIFSGEGRQTCQTSHQGTKHRLQR